MLDVQCSMFDIRLFGSVVNPPDKPRRHPSVRLVIALPISNRMKGLLQGSFALKEAEGLSDCRFDIEAGDQCSSQIVPRRNSGYMAIGADRNKSVTGIISQSARTDDGVIQFGFAQMVVGVPFRFVIMRDLGLAVHVSVDRAEHNVTPGSMQLRRHYRSYRADLIDEDGLILPCMASRPGSENDGITTDHGVTDRILQIGQDRGHAEVVEHGSLTRVANHSKRFVPTLG